MEIVFDTESEEIEARARELMRALTMSVPGELGSVVRAIVGVRERTGAVEATEATAPTGQTEATMATIATGAVKDPIYVTEIRPPARPIGWISSLLSLCCRVYGQPVERAVPVGACLELLGIASSALDAAQDGDHALMSRYVERQPPSGTTPEAENAAHLPKIAEIRQSAKIADVAGTTPKQCLPVPNKHDGSRNAVLVSNASFALVGLAWQALLEHGPRYGVQASTLVEIGQLIATRLVRICHAQHRDLTVGRGPAACLSLEEYERIIEGKTGEIDGTACEVAALLAGEDAVAHRRLWRTLGLERAVAQQLYDDYVDLAEDVSGGGQIGHPVLYGLAVADDAERGALLTLLERARANGKDVGTQAAAPEGVASKSSQAALRELLTILRGLGAEYYTLTCMVVHRNRALDALEALQLPADAHERLYRWVLQVAPMAPREPD